MSSQQMYSKFFYTPRSGDRIQNLDQFEGETKELLVRIHNHSFIYFSFHPLVTLKWRAADENNWWRTFAISAAKDFTSHYSGVVYDENGTVSITVPCLTGSEAWDALNWIEKVSPKYERKHEDSEDNRIELYKSGFATYDFPKYEWIPIFHCESNEHVRKQVYYAIPSTNLLVLEHIGSLGIDYHARRTIEGRKGIFEPFGGYDVTNIWESSSCLAPA